MRATLINTVSEGILSIVQDNKEVGKMIYSNQFGTEFEQKVKTHDELELLGNVENDCNNVIILDLTIDNNVAVDVSTLIEETLENFYEIAATNGYESVTIIAAIEVEQAFNKLGYVQVGRLDSIHQLVMTKSLH